MFHWPGMVWEVGYARLCSLLALKFLFIQLTPLLLWPSSANTLLIVIYHPCLSAVPVLLLQISWCAGEINSSSVKRLLVSELSYVLPPMGGTSIFCVLVRSLLAFPSDILIFFFSYSFWLIQPRLNIQGTKKQLEAEWWMWRVFTSTNFSLFITCGY